MTRAVSVDEALHGRMALIAQAMAQRIPTKAWRGYRATERLVGNYERPSEFGGAPTVTYTREGNPAARVTLGFLEMVDIREEERGEPVIIRAGIKERHAFDVSFQHAIHYKEEVSHEFERTVSFTESAQRAWEVGAKASFEAAYGGIKGAVEASAKYGETYGSQHSESTSERDRVSTLLEFTGPATFKLEAFRSRNRESRTIRARCDFDGKIYWSAAGEQIWEFTTFRSQFLPVIKRVAPSDIYGYREFREAPMPWEEIEAIEAPPDSVVEFTAEYDEVQTKTLREV